MGKVSLYQAILTRCEHFRAHVSGRNFVIFHLILKEKYLSNNSNYRGLYLGVALGVWNLALETHKNDHLDPSPCPQRERLKAIGRDPGVKNMWGYSERSLWDEQDVKDCMKKIFFLAGVTPVYKHHNNTIRLTIQYKAALTTCKHK